MSEQLIQLDPARILADDNSRFSLKQLSIDNLAADILEQGGVLQPVEVEEIADAKGKMGYTHRLTAGFYRLAAVNKLNTEQKAGLMMPAIVRNTEGDSLTRLRHQVSENVARESLSPMDQATVAKKMLDAGVSRGDVRRILARPGGKKGTEMQPLSNAMLNITLRFLELPKAIQERIHDGRVGVAAAYELGKVPPEKRQAVLDRAEAERQGQVEREAKEEEKFLAAEKKVQEAVTKQQAALNKVDEVKAYIDKAIAHVTEKRAALVEIRKIPFLDLAKAEQKETTEKLNAAIADLKAAEKLEKDAKNALAKLLNQAKSAAETVDDQRARLEAARKAIKTGKKANKAEVGPGDVKKAAQQEGVGGYIPLGMADIRDGLKDLIKQSDYAKVAAIGTLMRDFVDGKWTPKDLTDEIAVITGERAPIKAAPARVAPAAAAKPVQVARKK